MQDPVSIIARGLTDLKIRSLKFSLKFSGKFNRRLLKIYNDKAKNFEGMNNSI